MRKRSPMKSLRYVNSVVSVNCNILFSSFKKKICMKVLVKEDNVDFGINEVGAVCDGIVGVVFDGAMGVYVHHGVNL
jgi:hypothetical protein